MIKSQKKSVESRLVLDEEANSIIQAFGYVYDINSKEKVVENIIKKYPQFDEKVSCALRLNKEAKK